MGDVIEILTTATNTVEVEAAGPQGIPGVGVPTGGSTGQVLRKASSADYATEWAAAGSGSGSVTSVALVSSDFTISGSPITDAGTITANIAANAVTLEKLQTISSEHLLGRHGSGNGGVQQIGLGTGLAISESNVGVTFGSSAGTACEGNDARLSDARTPSSTLAHSSTHHTGGTDAIAPSDIGAQSIFVTEDLGTITTDANLTSSRAKIYTVIVNTFAAPTPSVRLPSTNIMAGDVVQIRFTSFTGRTMPIKNGDGSFLGAGLSSGQQATFIAASTASNSWAESPNNRFAVGTSSGVPIITGSSGYIGAGAFGTSAGQFAEGNHAHGNLTNDGKLGSTSGLPVVTTTAGAVTTLALGTANQVLRVNSGATGVEFADPAASGVTAVDATLADVMSVSGSDLIADDGGLIDSSDPFIKWDDTAGKLVYANPLSRTSGAFYVGLAPTTTALGTNSVNIQSGRDSATHLAKDASSVCVGYGARSTSSSATAVGHQASGANAGVAIGGSSSSSNDSIAVGFSANATTNATALGRSANASGFGATAIGYVVTASGTNSAIIGYQGLTAASLRAQLQTFPFSAIYWGGQTTNATPLILNLDATATNRFTIAANTALIADIFLIARSSDNTKFLSARRSVAIYRDNANVTALIGDVQTLGNDQSIGSPTWSIALTADNTNEALQLEVTGATGETVNWRATAFYRVV